MEATERYTSEKYVSVHTDWHLSGADGKARELADAIRALPQPHAQLTVADVGTGAGGVPAALRNMLGPQSPRFVGYEISAHGVRLGRERFPDMEFRQQAFTGEEGPFDATMFVDVLEHLENPWNMLRHARRASRFLIVRQPLLDNLGLFRHDKYKQQRDDLGHIAFFNYRSFLDMARATGWEPLRLELLPPWRLSEPQPAGALRPVKSLLARFAPVTASFLLEGFYLNGVFRAVDE